VLSRAGIERVSDLLGYTTKELMDIPGLGQKSLEEVRSRLADKGWSLAGEEAGRTDDEEETLLGVGVVSDEVDVDLLGGFSSDDGDSDAEE